MSCLAHVSMTGLTKLPTPVKIMLLLTTEARFEQTRHNISLDVRNAVGVSEIRRSDATDCRNKRRGNAHFNPIGHRLCTRLMVKPALTKSLVSTSK